MVLKSRYSIQEILQYRKVQWTHSNDFVYMTQVPASYEPFWIKPDYYCCGIVHSGKMVLDDGKGGMETVEKGSFLLFRPTQPFRILEIKPDTDGCFILFNRNFLVSFSEDVFYLLQNSFLNTLPNSCTILNGQDYNKLTILFSRVFQMLDDIDQEQWNYSAKGLILLLLNETNSILKNYKISYDNLDVIANKEYQKLVSSFLQLSSIYFSTHREISFYAEQLNVSVGHLHHVIKRVLNTTPVNIINKAVLKEAKLLLGYSENNISEIANLLLFSSVHAFSRFFKKHTGLAPSIYVNTLPTG